MSEQYLFYQGNKLKGVFNDKQILQKITLHHILDYYVEKKLYKDKKESGKKLKSKILNLYNEKIGFLEAHNVIWSIVKIVINQINDNIRNNNYKTSFTKIVVKGRNFSKKDLDYDLAYLKLDELYTIK